MRILLDTHCLLWARAAPQRLSRRARSAILSPRNDLFVSAASVWEIVVKHALGKLPLRRPPEELVPEMIAATEATTLPVTAAHALRVASLPRHHADPFDRMLVAQALVEGLTLLTADARLSAYGVKVLRA